MNLVNDITGTNSILMQNDQSQLTLNHVGGPSSGATLTNVMSQNQILLDSSAVQAAAPLRQPLSRLGGHSAEILPPRDVPSIDDPTLIGFQDADGLTGKAVDGKSNID